MKPTALVAIMMAGFPVQSPVLAEEPTAPTYSDSRLVPWDDPSNTKGVRP